MSRLFQVALLILFMIPVAWLIRSGHSMLSNEMKWFAAGIPAGMAIMLGLNAWDRRIRQRDGSERRGD